MTTLYRLYDETDRLLYVGVTGNLTQRMQQHESASPWFDDVDRTETVEYDDRTSALAEEAIAIAGEVPIHNRRLTGTKGPRDGQAIGADLAAAVIAEMRGEVARQGIRRGQLARATGIAGNSISRKMNGSNPMMLGEALVIANAIGVPLDTLVRQAEERAA